MQAKRVVFGSILEQRVAVHKDGWNVATSQRRDVATSLRRDVPTSRCWVNIYRSQQAATSQRPNVVTSQRRDVSTGYAYQSLKSKRGPEFGGSETEERTN